MASKRKASVPTESSDPKPESPPNLLGDTSKPAEAPPGVIVSKKGLARLRAGHLWVYSSDLVDSGAARSGEVVHIVDQRGNRFGYALYSAHSKIALRWIARADERIDRDFWRQRLAAAADYRKKVVTNTDAYRLAFGESDWLPSLIIDRYGDHFVVQTLSQGMEAIKDLWVELLIEQHAPRAVIERNDVKVRQLEGLPLQKGVLYGSAAAGLQVVINGLRFQVDLLEGQKTGAFLDQRENYLAAMRYARGRALDGFCYAGAFALHLAGRCQSVVALDISSVALAEAGRNAKLNGLTNIQLVEANVFDALRDFMNKKERFDIIVLDPPAFAKSHAALQSAIGGYKEINLRAMRLLEPGGILVTCSCSYHLSEEMFLGVLSSAAADIKRSVRIIEKRTQARDHPILLSMPETYYLKCVILQVER
jgi:23S rRNA (cytosine1962-C5)-methyltransferase